MFPSSAPALPIAISPALPVSLASARPASCSEGWSHAFNLWLSSHTSPNTRRAYQYAWQAFLSYNSKTPWQITHADIAGWVDHLRSHSLSTQTISQRLSAISSFYDYASRFSLQASDHTVFSNPVRSISRPQLESYRQSRYLSPEQARALLRSIPRHTLQGKRDYALFLAYLATGRRNSEIRLLRWGDFEPEFIPTPAHPDRQSITYPHLPSHLQPPLNLERTLRVYYRWTGKGKSRRDECPRHLWYALLEYLNTSPRKGSINHDSYLFTPLNTSAAHLPNVNQATWTCDCPLSMRMVSRLLKKYLRKAGINSTGVTVHSLRHTAAMLRKHAGEDVQSISSFLGHSSIATTQIYLDHVEGRRDVSWHRVATLLGLADS